MGAQKRCHWIGQSWFFIRITELEILTQLYGMYDALDMIIMFELHYCFMRAFKGRPFFLKRIFILNLFCL